MIVKKSKLCIQIFQLDSLKALVRARFSLPFPEEEKRYENSGQDADFNMSFVQAVFGLEKAAVDGIFSKIM